MNARNVLRMVYTATFGAVLTASSGGCSISGLLDSLFPPAAAPIPIDPIVEPVDEPVPTTQPVTTQPATTLIHTDINYTSPGSNNNTMDLHLPLDGIRSSVTILFIHGGGWFLGDKNDSAPIFELLALAGFPVVTCNYTLSTIESPGYPQAIYDVKAVVRWIRTEGAEFYGLPTKIVVVGESSGGHLALMLGTTDGLELFEPQLPYPGGYRVDAVIAFFAPGDLVYHAQHGIDGFSTAWFLGALLSDEMMPRYIEASPVTYVNEANPPIALLHGEADIVVPFEVAVRTQQAFANVCRHCRLVGMPDVGHGFDGFGGNEGAATYITDLIPTLLASHPEPDLNGDGAVNVLDIERFVGILIDSSAFFTAFPGCNRLQADLNGDGRVDGGDVAVMVSRILEG